MSASANCRKVIAGVCDFVNLPTYYRQTRTDLRTPKYHEYRPGNNTQNKMETLYNFLHILYDWQWFPLISALLTVYLTYYFFFVVKKPRIIGKDGPFRRFLVEKCGVLSEYYYPTIWCFGPHAQTVIRALLRLRPHVPFRR